MNPVHLPTREVAPTRTGPEALAPAGEFAQALEQAGRPREDRQERQPQPAASPDAGGSATASAAARPAGSPRPSASPPKSGAHPAAAPPPTAPAAEASPSGDPTVQPLDAAALARALGLDLANAESDAPAPAVPADATPAPSVGTHLPPPAPWPTGSAAAAGESSLNGATGPTDPSSPPSTATLGLRSLRSHAAGNEQSAASAQSVPEAAVPSSGAKGALGVTAPSAAPEADRFAAPGLSPLQPTAGAEAPPVGPASAPTMGRLEASAAGSEDLRPLGTRLQRADEALPSIAAAGREGVTPFGAAWASPALQAPALPQSVVVSPPLPLNQPAFAGELGVQVAAWTRQGVQQAELRLNPAELGPVQVSIQVEGVQTQIRFVAEASATREALQAALPELARALAQEGLTLGSADVHAQSHHQAPSQRPFTGGEARADGHGPGAAGSRAGAAEDLDDGGAGALHRPVQRGLVDLYA